MVCFVIELWVCWKYNPKLEPQSRGVEGPVASICEYYVAMLFHGICQETRLVILDPRPQVPHALAGTKLYSPASRSRRSRRQGKRLLAMYTQQVSKEVATTAITVNMVKIARPIKIKHVEQRQQWQQQQCNPEYACLKQEMQAMRQMMI